VVAGRQGAGGGSAPILRTDRLELIPVPPPVIEALLAGDAATAGAMLGVTLAAEGGIADSAVCAGWPIHLWALRVDPAELAWRIRVIVLREDRRAIGSINLKGPPRDDGTVDMGWGVDSAYRGRGFAVEAAQAVLRWVLGEPRVARLTARIPPDNLPSVRVARRLGMWRTGRVHPEQGDIWQAYRPKSWIDPRIEIRSSRLHGRGSFAREPIGAGEVVTVWGGELFRVAGGRLFALDGVGIRKPKPGSEAAVAEDLVLASRADAPDHADQFLNHSCEPNVWMRDEVTLAARQDIAVEEELTADYALWEHDEAHVTHWRCACGSVHCRRTITGRDWRLPDLQARYRGHFSPFITERIGRARR
jgi:uncharacterized protein